MNPEAGRDGEGQDGETYECWMCGMVHRNPVAYLWHMHACELEKTGSSALISKQEVVLSVAAIKK